MQLLIDPHQYTLSTAVNFHGVGLHSGKTVTLRVKPAPINSGIRFFRSDLTNRNSVKAHMDKVVDTRLATTIGENEIRVSTTEHIMAALVGCGIDNADIELDAPEVPIMDGSAAPFVYLLDKTGIKRQNGYKKVLKITKEISFSDGNSAITISPYNGFKVTGEISFDDSLIKMQKYSLIVDKDTFINEISKARTFGYVEQVEELWKNGLALGGTLDNVIAIHWDRDSILNEDGLRFDDEFIRHKVLDLIGDLALMGCPILGHVNAIKAGHSQHLAFMQTIANSPDCWDFIEIKSNESGSFFDQVAPTSNIVKNPIMPFIKYNNPQSLPASL